VLTTTTADTAVWPVVHFGVHSMPSVSTRSPLFGGLVVCVPEAIAGERGEVGECAIAFFYAANPQDAVVFAVGT
jgi:hypothetical protein